MSNNLFRCMLACDADLTKLKFNPYLIASPKLDGVRAIVRDGVVYSRSNKPIPNKYVQAKFKHLDCFDGELIVGSPTSHSVYRDTVSVVMSDDKPADDVRFFVFDTVSRPTAHYMQRAKALLHIPDEGVILHETLAVATMNDLLCYEQQCLDQGYEGLILRDPYTPYKMGRSTVKEGWMLKLKRFMDAEAVVIGFEERMHNGNEATTNELGRTKRSSHQAGKSGRGDLGALICRTGDGVEFNIGTGFSDDLRATIWANRDDYLGRYAKYKFFPVGVKEAPRHPVFLGWRDRRDM